MLLSRGREAVNGGALLSMRQAQSLHALIVVRKRKEEAEERKLIAITQRLQQFVAREKRLVEELANHTAARLSQVEALSNGFRHQEFEGRLRRLQHARALAVAEMNRLEAQRIEQMILYQKARCGREAISQIEEQRNAAHQAELSAREQKCNEDLILIRRARIGQASESD